MHQCTFVLVPEREGEMKLDVWGDQEKKKKKSLITQVQPTVQFVGVGLGWREEREMDMQMQMQYAMPSAGQLAVGLSASLMRALFGCLLVLVR